MSSWIRACLKKQSVQAPIDWVQKIPEKRFSGIFWTQSIGAWTDCFFKQALIQLLITRKWEFLGLNHENVILLAGAIFMAPYFLFSATAGQLADKLDKAAIIR